MSSGQKPFEQLLSACQPAHGEIHPQARPLPSLEQLTSELGLNAPEHVGAAVLSPPESVPLSPLMAIPAPGTIYRGPADHRSFSLAVEGFTFGSFAVQSLTVKGGDLPHARHIRPKDLDDAWRRLRNGQIPGGGDLSALLIEQAVAYDLQKRALETVGRATHVALPLQVRKLTEVQTPRGWQPIRAYLNSVAYSDINRDRERPNRAELLGVPRAEASKLGSYLMHTCGVAPAEYLYAIPGHNVRVETLAEAVHFTRRDSDGQPMYNLKGQARDPKTASDELPAQDRKDKVLRTVYGLLGKAYDFSVDDVLGTETITDQNYASTLRQAPKRCRKAGIDELVLDTFLDRLLEVAALTHAHDATLSGHDGVAGSFHPRNVTYGGVVLDLDTYSPLFENAKKYLNKDLHELTGSVQTLESLVSDQPAQDWPARIKRRYFEHAETFRTSSWLRA